MISSGFFNSFPSLLFKLFQPRKNRNHYKHRHYRNSHSRSCQSCDKGHSLAAFFGNYVSKGDVERSVHFYRIGLSPRPLSSRSSFSTSSREVSR